MRIYPAHIPCRFVETAPFAHRSSVPRRMRRGLTRLLTETDHEGPRRTAFMCHDMDNYLSAALCNGDMNIGYFPLIIRAYDRPPRPVPDEISTVRIELLGIRLMFEKKESFSHPYARDAGIIMQRLAIGDVDISGWMVSIKGDLAYLGRPLLRPVSYVQPELFEIDDRAAAKFVLSQITREGRPRLSHFER